MQNKGHLIFFREVKTLTAMTRIALTVFSIGLIISSCSKGKNNDNACNGKNTRRAIKLAIDNEAENINLEVITTTVDSIGSIEVPEIDKDSERQDVEKHVYSITATVHKLSKHRDGDWKVKLTNGEDQFVNCEAPNMGCSFITSSIFFAEMEEARQWIEDHQDEIVGKTVTVTGIGFIDIDHKYPRNAAANEMELHPILDIHY